MPRTKHDGGGGVHVSGYEQELSFQQRPYNTKPHVMVNLKRIWDFAYSLDMMRRLEKAVVVNITKHPCIESPIPKYQARIIKTDRNALSLLSSCLTFFFLLACLLVFYLFTCLTHVITSMYVWMDGWKDGWMYLSVCLSVYLFINVFITHAGSVVIPIILSACMEVCMVSALYRKKIYAGQNNFRLCVRLELTGL